MFNTPRKFAENYLPDNHLVVANQQQHSDSAHPAYDPGLKEMQ